MEVKQILVYGAGLMGRGIAQVFSRNPEYSIVLYDIAGIPYISFFPPLLFFLSTKTLLSINLLYYTI